MYNYLLCNVVWRNVSLLVASSWSYCTLPYLISDIESVIWDVMNRYDFVTSRSGRSWHLSILIINIPLGRSALPLRSSGSADYFNLTWVPFHRVCQTETQYASFLPHAMRVSCRKRIIRKYAIYMAAHHVCMSLGTLEAHIDALKLDVSACRLFFERVTCEDARQ